METNLLNYLFLPMLKGTFTKNKNFVDVRFITSKNIFYKIIFFLCHDSVELKPHQIVMASCGII